MIQVTIGRTMQLQPYESIRFEVTLDDTELTCDEGTSSAEKLGRLQVIAYSKVLDFERLHSKISDDERAHALATARNVFMPSPAKGPDTGEPEQAESIDELLTSLDEDASDLIPDDVQDFCESVGGCTYDDNSSVCIACGK